MAFFTKPNISLFSTGHKNKKPCTKCQSFFFWSVLVCCMIWLSSKTLFTCFDKSNRYCCKTNNWRFNIADVLTVLYWIWSWVYFVLQKCRKFANCKPRKCVRSLHKNFPERFFLFYKCVRFGTIAEDGWTASKLHAKYTLTPKPPIIFAVMNGAI